MLRQVVKLDQDFGASFAGVLTDDCGAVRAVWGSYSEQGADKEDREWCAGLPVAVAAPWIDRLRRSLAGGAPSMGAPSGAALADGRASGGVIEGEGDAPSALVVRVLDAELEALTMSKAASYGLPEAWVGRLTRFDPVRRQVRPWPPRHPALHAALSANTMCCLACETCQTRVLAAVVSHPPAVRLV